MSNQLTSSLSHPLRLSSTALTHEKDMRAFAQAIAVHASSLWDGFVFKRDPADLFHLWGEGGIELHFKMAELAMTDAQLCDALFAVTESSFPGVYTYEVTEALGDAVAKHLISTGGFPLDSEWQFTLGELVHDFFLQGEPTDLPMVSQVLSQYLPGWHAPIHPVEAKRHDSTCH